MDIRLPALHPSQQDVRNHLQRFSVVMAGRRWGKSRFSIVTTLERALTKRGIYWWVAPSYPQASIAWRTTKRLLRPLPVRVLEQARVIELPNGSSWVFKSAHDEDSLRGEGIDGLVMDEVASINEQRWLAELRPSLLDTQGWVIFAGTPKGKNWVYRLFADATDKLNWYATQRPSSDNPKIRKSELEEAKGDTPEYLWNQEYLAQFIDDGMGVFRFIQELSILTASQPQQHEGHTIYLGVDLGKQNDFTVIDGFCSECKEQVMMDRFNLIDYRIQKLRIKAASDLWKPRKIVVEKNNVGEAVIEDLKAMGLTIEVFSTTGESKPPLIEDLALAMELKEIHLINNEVQKAELSVFEMNTTKLGHRQYAAAGSYHDDCPMGLALAYRGVKHGRGPRAF